MEPCLAGSHQALSCMIYVTVHPDQIERSVLESVDTVAALGDSPDKTIAGYCAAIGKPVPPMPETQLVPGEAILWERSGSEPPFKLHIAPSEMERRRHRRKYAEGELPPDRSFYFKGPAGQLNLRAQNLILFMQIAEGVDEATWMYHLRDRALFRMDGGIDQGCGSGRCGSQGRAASATSTRQRAAGSFEPPSRSITPCPQAALRHGRDGRSILNLPGKADGNR